MFWSPASVDYQELHAAAFGKPLPLPEPLAFDLETTDFL